MENEIMRDPDFVIDGQEIYVCAHCGILTTKYTDWDGKRLCNTCYINEEIIKEAYSDE